ncbi:hypothetical protein BGZ80_001886 [Entomortierella chlamydospora]|uniref:Protein kinase domain-containing protein n=1 Tax=Entomortierella chlamydospora TaxID=101097 RepID=A0A9P6MQK9_9FUNG|nr:hypothetical protein BGZ79_001326 [Entomortierella chlamydospora]KAG0009979.1 hypothetical protein BGZ80_001886 [Entomortierella chlamydospora]
MTDRTAPVVLFSAKEQQWLDGAINGNLLRLINFDDIEGLQMGVASGGFGVIHAGRWREMRVAVKVLYNSADFIQEVTIHKLVQDSENIVKFYGITQIRSTGDYGMVLQYAGKGSLRDYLSKHFDSLDWANKMRLARDVTAGISFIHEDNICHHDLHSRNVLIDQSGRALITDFGLSRYLNNATSNNGVRGVVPYISPERLKNAPFDHSSDIYSLGVIMWELTSGRPPFSKEENFMLPYEIITGRREEIIPGTPVEYSDLYQQCWDGEPVNRPHVRDILKTLNHMLTRHNGEEAEAKGTIQPVPPRDLSGPRSLPTGTTGQTSTALSRNSEPIVGQMTSADNAKAAGGPTKSLANVKPLQVKGRDRSVTFSPPDFEHGSALRDRFSQVVISDGQSVNTPPTPNRLHWIHGPAQPTGGGGGSPVRSVSPKPPAATYVPHDMSRQSPTSGVISAAIPEIGAVEDFDEKGDPAGIPSYPQHQPKPVYKPHTISNSSNRPTELATPTRMNYPPSVTPYAPPLADWMPRDGKSRIRDFFTACRNGNLEAIKWHLAHGANVMEPYDTMSGRTPLHAAAMSNNLKVMTLLCESAGPNLNLNELDDGSQTPLHLLTQFGDNNDLLEYMLKMGANPNIQDSERRTPLMTAVILNDNAVFIETLLDYGADPNIKCQENNALAEAAIRLRYHCVKVLLDTDLSMSEQSSLLHAMDVCYRVTESVNRNLVLSLLVRWKHAEGLQKRQTLATMILRGSLPFGEKRIDQRRLARQVLAAASH